MRMLALAAALTLTLAAHAVTPFELPQMNHDAVGTLYKSADQKNGVFVVEAYFLGCPYCNDNAPNVDKLASDFKTEARVQVLDVGVDKSDSDYEEWIDRHHPNHPVLKDANRALIRQLGTTGYPSTYVLDCKLNVLYKTSGVWNAGKVTKIKEAIATALRTVCDAEALPIVTLPFPDPQP